jgi:cyclopropane fatty-acyl-phospholipid synthase-like methyltransferase
VAALDRLHAGLPIFAKRYAWNLKYGVLGYPQLAPPHDVVSYLSARLPENASILELGCGRGSLLRGLREAGWHGTYCGVDISKQAIRAASKFQDQRSSWVVSDFESFRTPFQWDVVAMIESVCYVKTEELTAFLTRIAKDVKPGGVLLIRLHDFDKHKSYIELVQRLYPHAEKVSPNLLSILADYR